MTTKTSSNSTETSRGQERTANVITAIAAILCGIPVAMVAQRFGSVPALGISLVAVAGIYLAIGRLGWQNRIVSAGSVIAALIGMYGAEFVMTTRQSRQELVASVAKRLGRTADLRTVAQVVDDFKSQGITAYPCCVAVWDYAGLPGAREVLPLASRSNTLHVMCNESGSYITFMSDEHGFHNPSGLWNKENVEVVTIGDSFTEGFCVQEGDHYVDALRRRFPATVNLGLRGSGPLLQLAVLKEYGPQLKPHAVIWAFFENDLDDLKSEKSLSGLRNYLKPGFRQHLASRQAEIDGLAELVVQNASRSAARQERVERLENMLKLSTLRAAVGSGLLLSTATPPDDDWDLLFQILAQAKTETESWGGALYLAYLPGAEHFVSTKKTPMANLMHERTLAGAEKLGIETIDILPEFSKHATFSSLFFYPGSHYTEEGYSMVAKAVLAKLADSHFTNSPPAQLQ